MKCGTMVLVCGLVLTTCSSRAEEENENRIAPLLEGMGAHSHKVTTSSAEAQRFFDQGVVLAWGFNHAEAERSFREAARVDPDCAMAWWGVALVLGPNINAVMSPEAVPKATEAIQRARSLADSASLMERDYIDALSKRYAEGPPEDRTALDEAYADAMRQLVKKYPDNMEARTLLAEALMDLHPWDYWLPSGEARPWTAEIVEQLEHVLEHAPEHPGANHLYIHAVEASQEPQRALAAADRLGGLAPGAGHLVHMPSHIYIRTGRYHKASLANQQAIKSDNDYVTQCHAQGIYPLAYMPHNRHFLWAASTFEGRSETAIRAAQRIAKGIDHEKMREEGLGTLQHFWVTPIFALVRFGRWDKVLQLPAPDEDLLYPRAMRHYARALAFIRQGQLDKAEKEQEELEGLVANPALKKVTIWDINTTAALVAIAAEVVAGELAAAREEYEPAILRLNKAIELEDGLTYSEPEDWHSPTRLTLGAVLLKARRYAEAAEVYRDDLKEHPRNGWALFGLEKALRGQQKTKRADRVKQQFEKTWRRADVELTSSRF